MLTYPKATLLTLTLLCRLLPLSNSTDFVWSQDAPYISSEDICTGGTVDFTVRSTQILNQDFVLIFNYKSKAEGSKPTKLHSP